MYFILQLSFLPHYYYYYSVPAGLWLHTDQKHRPPSKKKQKGFSSILTVKSPVTPTVVLKPNTRSKKRALSRLENCKNWVKEKCVCLCVLNMRCTRKPTAIFVCSFRVAARRWAPPPSRHDLFVSFPHFFFFYRVENECRTPDIHHINAL